MPDFYSLGFDGLDFDDIPLECPKCHRMNLETRYEAYHYECACGFSYDFCVCDHCEAEIGIHSGDEGVCPVCFEHYTTE